MMSLSGASPTGSEGTCGLEFDFANEESFYCRPLRQGDGRTPERMSIPPEAGATQIAFLPPMSGLAATETRLDHGAVNVRVGEGRTAEVLRNLCFRIHQEHPSDWEKLVAQIEGLFGAVLEPPHYIEERGEIAMSYQEQGVTLDLASSGRGLQQTLLILAYMYANPGAVLLLDEPDAHLEILRQRQIYRLLTEAATGSGSQIIAASHSEVLLNEAAGQRHGDRFRRSAASDCRPRAAKSARRLRRLDLSTITRPSRRAGCSISKARRTFPSCRLLLGVSITTRQFTCLSGPSYITSGTSWPRHSVTIMA